LLPGLMAFLIVVVQGGHPWLHPLALMEPSADPPLTCPVGHVVGHLPTPLPAPVLTRSVLVSLVAPCLWPGRLAFIHPLLPRPPPTPAC
jgi:hypothetical protein